MKHSNEAKKIDLRVLKTKKLLCTALFELLEEKQIDRITVQEICARAMVNRMTFYKHYSDKYALLKECVENTFAGLLERVERTSPLKENPSEYCSLLVKSFITYCDENRTVLKTISSSENILSSNILYGAIQTNMEDILKRLSEGRTCYLPLDYSAAFLTGGAVRGILYWINDENNYTKEKLFADLMAFFEHYVKIDIFFHE